MVAVLPVPVKFACKVIILCVLVLVWGVIQYVIPCVPELLEECFPDEDEAVCVCSEENAIWLSCFVWLLVHPARTWP
jgi:hypothetical protein